MANLVRYPLPLNVFPSESCKLEVRYPPPPSKGYLSNTCAIPFENKANGCDTPVVILSRKGIARYGGASRTEPLRNDCHRGQNYYKKKTFQKKGFGTSNVVKITKQSLYKANPFGCSLANRGKPCGSNITKEIFWWNYFYNKLQRLLQKYLFQGIIL